MAAMNILDISSRGLAEGLSHCVPVEILYGEEYSIHKEHGDISIEGPDGGERLLEIYNLEALEKQLVDGESFSVVLIGEGVKGNPYALKGRRAYVRSYAFENVSKGLMDIRERSEELGLRTMPIHWSQDVEYKADKTKDELIKSASAPSMLNQRIESYGTEFFPVLNGYPNMTVTIHNNPDWT